MSPATKPEPARTDGEEPGDTAMTESLVISSAGGTVGLPGVRWLSSPGVNACRCGRRSEGYRDRRQGPRAGRCRLAGAAGRAGRPWRGRWELEWAPGIYQRPAAAGDAAGEGCRLPVPCELGCRIRRCGRGDGGIQLAAPSD